MTLSGQSIERKSISGESPSPITHGSVDCPLDEFQGNCRAATHSPPMRATADVPMPLALVRICCAGSMRPRNEIVATGARPSPGPRISNSSPNKTAPIPLRIAGFGGSYRLPICSVSSSIGCPAASYRMIDAIGLRRKLNERFRNVPPTIMF